MTGLERWLNRATRYLSKDSAAQVRTEITQHFESAREAALSEGADAAAADLRALAALGDPKTANCQYRRVLLTSAEARLLRQGERELRAICSRWLVKVTLRWLALPAMLASAALFVSGADGPARVVLAAALGMAFLFTVPFLPVYTLARGRLVRCAKWIALAAMPLLAFGPDAHQYLWLLIACLWPVAWVEYTRYSIRRKLPVARWPRHLYL